MAEEKKKKLSLQKLGVALKEFYTGLKKVFAPLASPAFTGTPTAPTASPGTNNTQIATTEYVDEAVKSGGQDLSDLFNDVSYDSDGKKIQFKHGSSVVKELDATPFIKDGMVNTVTVTDGKTGEANNGKKVLLITFNTDSGKEDIEIPLTDIFDPSNFYNKTEADETFAKKSTTIGGYGITDAKIEDGTITLGSETITPLTDEDFEDYSDDEIKQAVQTAMADA